MKKLFVIAAVFLYPCLEAQPHVVDSIKKILVVAKDDSNKVSMLTSLAGALADIDSEQSSRYAREGLVLSEKIGFRKGILKALTHLGRAYVKQRKNNEADDCFERAEKIAGEIKSYEVLRDFYDAYSLYFEDKKDYRNAYKYHVLFSNTQDSLCRSIAEIKTQYETSILAKENENLGTENRLKVLAISQENSERNIFIIVFIFLVAIVVLLISRMRLKNREELSKELLVQQEIRSRSVIEEEERERSRIARELNDGIGQQLSAAKLNISALQSFLKSTSDADKIMLQNTVDLLDDSVKEVRNVSHSMIPNALIKSGLVSAVREFISKVGAPANMEINLEVVGQIDRLHQTKEAVLFRVMQELVNNSMKHANPSKVNIQLIKHEKELSILVEDNGIGFDVETILKNSRGIGLKSIQSRVAFLNGSVFFDSRPTKGTTVSIEIPM